MYNIGMLLEMHGMRSEEVTIAEVLSNTGYATAFHGKWHLGDIEESYPHNQGFDEAFFTGYNQILSLNTKYRRVGESTLSDQMRVGELIFEFMQRGSIAGGLKEEHVQNLVDILKKEITFYDSPENMSAVKWDKLVSESLRELCTALEEVWMHNPRGLRLHEIGPHKMKYSKATSHAILHATREELVTQLEQIFAT